MRRGGPVTCGALAQRDAYVLLGTALCLAAMFAFSSSWLLAPTFVGRPAHVAVLGSSAPCPVCTACAACAACPVCTARVSCSLSPTSSPSSSSSSPSLSPSQASPPPSHAGMRAPPPVVYVWSTEALADYAIDVMRHTARYAPVVLITAAPFPTDLGHDTNVTVVSAKELETVELLEFRARYKPWGLREPWERQNMERFFVLHAWMERERVDRAMYLDSDVALLAPPPLPESECDAYVDLSGGGADMSANSFFWAVWAGSSVLDAHLLKDFLGFALEMYASLEAVAVLEEKRAKAPYVCDMTLWYLFVVASAAPEEWKAQELARRLPSVPRRWRFCDSDRELHMDHRQGHRLNPKWRYELNSIHFQDDTKRDARAVLAELDESQMFRCKLREAARHAPPLMPTAVFVVEVNAAYLELAFNLARTMALTKPPVRNVVWVALDAGAHEALEARNFTTFFDERDTFSRDRAAFLTPEYLRITRHKLQTITRVLELGFEPIFLDVDVVMLRNPLNFMVDLPRCAASVTTESFGFLGEDSPRRFSGEMHTGIHVGVPVPPEATYINCGFMHFTADALPVLKEFMAEPPVKDEQNDLNTWLLKRTNAGMPARSNIPWQERGTKCSEMGGLTFNVLSPALFGSQRYVVHGPKLAQAAATLPAMIHYNFVIGTYEDKVALMRADGMLV